MTRDDARKLIGQSVTINWGTHESKAETATGTVVSAGRRTLWLYTDGRHKPAQDVFIKYGDVRRTWFA